ncbi:unnamed protein product, partial [Ectocarpus sp. 12 AP-2014]
QRCISILPLVFRVIFGLSPRHFVIKSKKIGILLRCNRPASRSIGPSKSASIVFLHTRGIFPLLPSHFLELPLNLSTLLLPTSDVIVFTIINVFVELQVGNQVFEQA